MVYPNIHEKSPWEHNNLVFLKSISLLANFQWSKFHGNWWCFKSTRACLKHSKTLLWTMVFFPFKCLFSYQMCTIPFQIRRGSKYWQWSEVTEIHVYNAFYHFWCKHDFGLQNYEIWWYIFKLFIFIQQ
jgi:hypothetical protein